MPNDPARVKEVFLAAAALTAVERPLFLDSACGGDHDLRAAVERLLVAHERPDSVLDGSLRAPTETMGEDADPDTDVPVPLAPPEEPGSLGRLDHYEVLALVGRGGMGVVLKAHDTHLRRVVALKLLAPELCTNGSARKRFAREARAAAAVRDEHVVGVHAVRQDAPVPYLVMEFVGGTNLEEVVRAGGPLEVKEVLRIGMQAARGLAAAHAQGLVHRDVKPANILLENGIQRVKLTDFGLARAIDDASVTQSGVLAGTPLYMSPEQAAGKRVDHRTDLFSLGSVLYTLCTGRPAFRASGTAAVIRRVCEDAPRPIREINPDVPAWLAHLVTRLMAKAPADRFQTAAEVAELLGQGLAHLQQPESVPAPAAPAPDRPEAPRREGPRALRWLAGAVLVAASGLLASYLALRPGAPTERSLAPSEPTGATSLQVVDSPLQTRTRADIPQAHLSAVTAGTPVAAPAELVAVLGVVPFGLPGSGPIQYPAQTRDGRLLAVPRGQDVVVLDTTTGAVRAVLTGLPGRVAGVGFSPDGRRVAAGSWDDASPVLVWDVETGGRVFTLKGHTVGVNEVVFSPDGKQIASGGSDRSLRIWDAATGQFDHQLEGATDTVCGVVYDPAGKWIAGHSTGGMVWVWENGRRTDPRVLTGVHPQRSTVRAAVSPDGKWLAAGSAWGTMVWATSDWAEKWSLAAPGDWTAFTPDSETLLTAKHDCTTGTATVRRWAVADGKELPALSLTGTVNWMVYHLSPDGKTLFSMAADPPEAAMRVYDAATGRERFDASQPGPALCSTFSPDGRVLCAGTRDGSVWLWDLAGWAAGAPFPPARRLTGGVGSEARFVAYSPDGRTLAAVTPKAGGAIWDVASGRQLGRFAAAPDCTLAFAPDGRTLAVPQENGSVRWLDPETGKERDAFALHGGPVTAVAFSPDGRFMASTGRDGACVVTDVRTRTPRPVTRPVACTGLAFTTDGNALVGTTGLPDVALRLWDAATGAELPFRADYTDRGAGLAVCPDGRTAATVGRDQSIRVWDLTAGGARFWPCPIRVEGVRQSVAYSPDGRFLSVVSSGGALAVLRPPAPVEFAAERLPVVGSSELAGREAPADALNRADIAPELLKPDSPAELVAVLGGATGHAGQVNSVAVGPGGRHLASAGADGTVRLWDLATGKLLHTASRPNGEAYTVAFGPGGRWIAGWRYDGLIVTHDPTVESGWRELATHGRHLTALAVSPDGTALASVGKDGCVRLWELPTDPARRAPLRRVIPIDGVCAWCVAFSPDGRTLAVGGEKGVVRLIDARSGWVVGTFRRGGWVRWVGFHPSGGAVAAASTIVPEGASTVAVWDPATRAELFRPAGYREETLAGAWRADGGLLLTAAADLGRLERWDVGNKARAAPPIAVTRPARGSWFHGLALTPDGRHAVTANPDGTVYVLRLAERASIKVGEP